jgi:hypothetical protein
LWNDICSYRILPGLPAISLPRPAAGKKTSLPASVKKPQAIGAMRFSDTAGDFIPAVGGRQGNFARPRLLSGGRLARLDDSG